MQPRFHGRGTQLFWTTAYSLTFYKLWPCHSSPPRSIRACGTPLSAIAPLRLYRGATAGKAFLPSTVTMIATVHNWFLQKRSEFGKLTGLWCQRGFASFRLKSSLKGVKTNNKKCFQNARLCSYLHSREGMSCPLHQGDDKLFPLLCSSIVYKVKRKNVTLDSTADVLLVTTLLIAKYFLPI